MAENISWMERRKELVVKYLSLEKENMRPDVRGVKSKSIGRKDDVVAKSRGLSVRTDNRRNEDAPSISRPAISEETQFRVYSDSEEEKSYHRSRSRVRSVRKQIVVNGNGSVRQQIVVSGNRNNEAKNERASTRKKALEAEKPSTLYQVSHRCCSENNLSRRAAASSDMRMPRSRSQSNEVKKRTLLSIQSWKERMRKSGNVGSACKNLPSVYPGSATNANKTEINLQQNCFVERAPSISRQESNINNKFLKTVVQKAVRSLSNDLTVFVQNATLNASSGVSAVSSSTSGNQPKIARRNSNSNADVTPADGACALPLTPTKVRYYEKRRAKRNPLDFDDVDPTKYQYDYLEDVLLTERKRDKNAPKLSSRFLHENVNAQQRKIIVAYLLRLSTHYHYSSHVIYWTVKLFDVAIDRVMVDTDHIQLLALTCLWITLKRDAAEDKIPSATIILKLAKDMYSGQEKCLLMYEKKILSALGFNVWFADPFSLFSYYIWRATLNSQCDSKCIYFYASYFIDLTMLDESLCNTSVCVLAKAAIELSLELSLELSFEFSSNVNIFQFWKHIRSILILRPEDLLEEWEEREVMHVKEVMIKLALQSDRKSKEFASNVVYKKYLRSQNGRISNLLLDKLKKIFVASVEV